MSAPVSPLGRLNLDDMNPTPRTVSRIDTNLPAIRYPEHDSSSESDNESSISDAGESDTSSVVRSPTRLTYRLDHLPDKTQSAVRETFKDPPNIAIQRCRRMSGTYAFQMTEVVTRSVRIQADKSGASSLTCSCGQSQSGDEPCQHSLWLLDQLVKETLYNHDQNEPLTMNTKGYAQEMGDPFRKIADYHLDVLADGLLCQVIDPETDSEAAADDFRTHASRELLSSVYGIESQDFNTDIRSNPTPGQQVIEPHDLEYTVFRMLLDNRSFFDYFIYNSRLCESLSDPFRHLSRRVDRVLRDLDAYSASFVPSVDSEPRSTSAAHAETPQNVSWAAWHIDGTVRMIHSAIFNRDRPLTRQETASAARALIHILSCVVNRNKDLHPGETVTDRNLYQRLIGDQDRGFIIPELRLLPAASSQFLSSLETILDLIGIHGAPPTYMTSFRDLLARLRGTGASGSGLKRSSYDGGSDRSSKRMRE